MFYQSISYLKSFFASPSAEMIALTELEEAKRRLLEAYSYREEAECRVRCYTDRIDRLTDYLHASTEAKQ
jgi:hypothetical protein